MIHNFKTLSALLLSFLGVASFSIKLEVDTSSSKQDQKIEGAKEFKYYYKHDTLVPPQISKFSTDRKTISEIKCMDYIYELMQRKDNTDNPVDVSIINGKVVQAAEYPHMGALGWLLDGNKTEFLCGASLISDRFMLTAAHCTYTKKTGSVDPVPVIVRLGTRYIEKPQSETLRDIRIEKLICHPKYNSPKKYYDIALVKLAERVTFSKFIQPACLAQEDYDVTSKDKLIATGWGQTHTGTRLDEGDSRVLRSLEIDVFDQKQCEDLLKRYVGRCWSGMRQHEMCAGLLDGSADTCQGDSGGPLQYLLLNTTQGAIHRIISITSFGLTKCGMKNAPGVYTKISSMLGWIEYNVWWSENRN